MWFARSSIWLPYYWDTFERPRLLLVNTHRQPRVTNRRSKNFSFPLIIAIRWKLDWLLFNYHTVHLQLLLT